jgi:hypothetical protein
MISRFTPQMFASMGYGVYIFFATLMILSMPYVYFLIPETKNVPLEDMDRLFAPDLKRWKAHKIVMHEVRARGGLDIEGSSSLEDVKGGGGVMVERT